MKLDYSAAELENSLNALKDFSGELSALPEISLSGFEPSRTALIIVDVINGFINTGSLHDKKIAGIIPECVSLLQRCRGAGIPAIAFADSHNPASAEFSAFPPHCVAGREESEIIDELKQVGGYKLIEKNSTNGFHCTDFLRFMMAEPLRKIFVVCGDCTDICIINFCLSLKTFMDEHDISGRIIVPVNACETFNTPLHNGLLYNLSALMLMRSSGIEIVKGIT